MMTHDEFEAIQLSDPAFKTEFDALEEEFVLLGAMVKARNDAGMSQHDVAKCMNTKQSNIARIEANGGSKKHSPSLNTLRKYAKAVDCALDVRFVPLDSIEAR
jgi:DNA-binding XRE family transcriptional regulator